MTIALCIKKDGVFGKMSFFLNAGVPNRALLKKIRQKIKQEGEGCTDIMAAQLVVCLNFMLREREIEGVLDIQYSQTVHTSVP